MTDEINPSELGAFTNNLPNKEGIKKLCEKVNSGSGGVEYTAGDNIQISAENVISATDTKYTAGTGISISEQNVISATGGSGGEWALRTPDNDWSDLFELASDGIVVTAKKNILMWDTTNASPIIIIKGEFKPYGIVKYTNCTSYVNGNEFFVVAEYKINGSQIPSTSTSISCNYRGYKYDNTNNTFTAVSSNNSSQKNNITIYTKD